MTKADQLADAVYQPAESAMDMAFGGEVELHMGNHRATGLYQSTAHRFQLATSATRNSYASTGWSDELQASSLVYFHPTSGSP